MTRATRSKRRSTRAISKSDEPIVFGFRAETKSRHAVKRDGWLLRSISLLIIQHGFAVQLY
jgi:hypothetical protein